MIEKVTARVFCKLEAGKGGNPVTIFSSSVAANDDSSSSSSSSINPIQQSSTQVRLAQSCEWESVMVDETNRTMAFYMPTGEQIQFCAHAAMGGAIQLARQTEERFTFFSTARRIDNANANNNNNSSDSSSIEPQQQQQDQVIDQEYSAIVHENDIVSLEMSTTCWSMDRIHHAPALHRLLRDALGLQSSDLVPLQTTTTTSTNDASLSPSSPWMDFPTFTSVDVVGGRAKTLVYVNSMQALQQKCRAPSNADAFRKSCDALGPPSTGLYLYSPCVEEDGAWECRQFPRASGYPEDPATGVAAAALAVALRIGGGIILPHYKFYQGTTMGKSSLIMVDDLRIQDEKNDDSTLDANDDMNVANSKRRLSYRLLGRIEIDDQEEIDISDLAE
jgi:predicted PhzF superfamily epimerase YddE/YHI9